MKRYLINNDNKIKEMEGGLKKDNLEAKVRFDLIPYSILYRIAMQFTNGAKKYGENNWKKAKDMEQANIFMQAGDRHTLKWVDGQDDEDHAAAAITNIIMYEWHKEKNTK